MLPKSFTIESRELWFQLKQDYLLEALLRPIFVWGVGAGTLLLLLALATKDTRLKMTALIMLMASGLAIIPYSSLRAEAGRERPIAQLSRAPSADFSANASRLRRETRWVFLGLAALAGAAAVWRARPRLGSVFTAASAVGGVVALATGIWLEAYEARAMHYSPHRKAASLLPPPPGLATAVASGPERADSGNSRKCFDRPQKEAKTPPSHPFRPLRPCHEFAKSPEPARVAAIAFTTAVSPKNTAGSASTTSKKWAAPFPPTCATNASGCPS